MKYLILVLTLSISATAYSDVTVDCNKEKLEMWESKHCARSNDVNAKENYFSEYNKLLKELTSKHAINNIKKAHELWTKVITIDCDLWAYSPLNEGSRNPDEEGCLAEKYKSRTQQIEAYREAWIQ